VPQAHEVTPSVSEWLTEEIHYHNSLQEKTPFQGQCSGVINADGAASCRFATQPISWLGHPEFNNSNLNNSELLRLDILLEKAVDILSLWPISAPLE